MYLVGVKTGYDQLSILISVRTKVIVNDIFATHLIVQYHYISLHCFSIWVSVQESLQASVPSPHASNAQESIGGRPLAFQNISPVSRAQGAPDTSELARILPQKYRRKLMSVEEIEYIQVSLSNCCVFSYLPNILLTSAGS